LKLNKFAPDAGLQEFSLILVALTQGLKAGRNWSLAMRGKRYENGNIQNLPKMFRTNFKKWGFS